MHRLVPTLILASVVGLGGCADFPALDDTLTAEDRASDFPTLGNLDAILAGAPTARSKNDITDLNNRLARLRSKANQLRGAVIGPSDRQRLVRGVAVPASIR